MFTRPHASPSGTSSALRALAFLPGRVSCAAEACGLFLHCVHARMVLFFALNR